ncbi:MAG: cytochrome c [Flavobacteriales bacterium]|nr:MAG: cytochrome c [Flavobacteriales bacterium]
MSKKQMVPNGSLEPSGVGVRQRRTVYFILIGLFVLQSGLIYTVSTEASSPAAELNASARRGEALYREFNCTACHQFYGLGGHMGPDLTNVAIAQGKGPEYARAFILHGSGRMPMLGVSKEQADDLVAFLEAVAATGTYPIRNLDLTPWGTYQQMHGDAK